MPSELAALRGEPSYVWRSGQERRLNMILRYVKLDNRLLLDYGCGNGTYASQFRRRFSPHVEACEIEAERVAEARADVPDALVAAAENAPYAANRFDFVFSNEVIEHVQDDRATMAEMIRITRPGGRLVIFCPNRWYPVEQHGHYWKGQYHFGNTPLINYLPDRWRNQLAPHVRTYSARGLRALLDDQPVRVIAHTRIFGGYDNITRRLPLIGGWLRAVLYALEKTPFRFFGLSHFLVLEKI